MFLMGKPFLNLLFPASSSWHDFLFQIWLSFLIAEVIKSIMNVSSNKLALTICEVKILYLNYSM